MSLRRLDQLLSSLGYCSRRSAKEFIQSATVMVGDELATRGDQRVDPAVVTVDGEALEMVDGLTVLYYKPLDCVCTRAEDEATTIYELLPPNWSRRHPPLTSVGRLDKDTTGALIITDQGPLVQKLTSPKSNVEKVYEVTVDRDLDPELVNVFASGTLMLRSEDTPCLPARLEIKSPREATLTLTEGRYHQVRRMFASQGWEVLGLHRSRFGKLALEGLNPGEWRVLDATTSFA